MRHNLLTLEERRREWGQRKKSAPPGGVDAGAEHKTEEEATGDPEAAKPLPFAG